MSIEGKVEGKQVLTGKITSFGIDSTLTKKSMCADAKATGDAIETIRKQINDTYPYFAENIKQDNPKSSSTNVQGMLDELLTTVGDTKKQLIPYPFIYSTMTRSGATFTPNSNGTVTVNGTVEDSTFSFYTLFVDRSYPIELKAGTYILNGCPKKEGHDYSLIMYSDLENSIYDSDNPIVDCGDGVKFTIYNDTKFSLEIHIGSGEVLENVEFKPMIRYASIEDSTFESYKPSFAHRFFSSEVGEEDAEFLIGRNRTCLIVVSNETCSDLFLVTNYDDTNQHVSRVTNNNTNFNVRIIEGVVIVKSGGNPYTYFKIEI